MKSKPLLCVSSSLNPVRSWCHAEDSCQFFMTSEPKRGKPNNIHRQESLENGRKIIALQELLLTNFVITFKNACNYALLFFTLEVEGMKQEKKW